MPKAAVIIGATGLVGNHLLKQLLEDGYYSKVKVFTRRSTNIVHPKLNEVIIDFKNLADVKNAIAGDVLFSCLGTTLKQAGSKEAQYKVDFSYQQEFAKLAKENEVTSYFLVSSTGADAQSSFFYPRMKGELEEAIQKLNFDRTVLIQPSVLQGDRENTRLGERFGAIFINALGKIIPPLKKYRSIHGRTVAAAMNRIFKSEQKSKVEIYRLDELFF